MTKKKIQKDLKKRVKQREEDVLKIVAEIEDVVELALLSVLEDIKGLPPEEAIGALNSFFQQIDSYGYPESIAKVEGLFVDELRHVKSQLKIAGEAGTLKGVSPKVVEALIDLDIAKIDNAIASHVGDMKSVIARDIATGKITDLKAVKDSVSAKTFSNIATEVNTSAQAFNRSVTIAKGKELYGDNPRFLYLGPDDSKTRDFCRGVLLDRTPPIYSLSEIEAMDNQQGLPVPQYGGGYNCRHDWALVSPELEKTLNGDKGN